MRGEGTQARDRAAADQQSEFGDCARWGRQLRSVRHGVRLRGAFVLLLGLVALAAPSSALAAGTWSAAKDIDAKVQLDSVSCASASFCAAVDENGNALTYNGSSWRAAAIRAGVGVRSVSCPSASFCLAVSGGDAYAYHGSSWGGSVSVSNTGDFVSVSCPSASFCARVGGNVASTYNGSAFSAPVTVPGASGLQSVSCTSASFCVAVNWQGNAFTYNGSSWSAAGDIDQGRNLETVSCPSRSFCMAGDNTGSYETYNGSSWGRPTQLTGLSFSSISCESASFCMAGISDGGAGGEGGIAGYTWAYVGGTWAAKGEPLIEGYGVDGVSCPSASFCAAVDSGGNAYIYTNTRGGGGGAPPGSPVTRITKAKITAKQGKATFSFSGTRSPKGFQCELIKPKARFRSCRSPTTYKHLKPGKYAFKVRAFNAAGIGATATKRFTIKR